MRLPLYLRLVGRLRMLIPLGLLVALLLVVWFGTIRMPGRTFADPLPPLTPEQQALGERLRRQVLGWPVKSANAAWRTPPPQSCEARCYWERY